MDNENNELEKSPEFRRVEERIKDTLVEQNPEGFDRGEIVENTEEVREIIHNELDLEGRELEEATAEALVYVAEETIKDAREAGGLSTEEDVDETTQAVLIEGDEKGAELSDNPVQQMVDDGFGAEVEAARKKMQQGETGAETAGEEGYDKLVPELHIKDSEDGKLNELIQKVYQSVEEGDNEEAVKAELREAIKRFVGETRSEKIFGEQKANFEPKTRVHNWIVKMNQDLAGAVGEDAADELIERRVAALKWLEEAFGAADFAVLEGAAELTAA